MSHTRGDEAGSGSGSKYSVKIGSCAQCVMMVDEPGRYTPRCNFECEFSGVFTLQPAKIDPRPPGTGGF